MPTHHQDSCYVKYVKIVFFSQNCTTIFQPPDQGITSIKHVHVLCSPCPSSDSKERYVPQAVYIFQPRATLSLWNLQGHHHHHHGHKNPLLAQMTAIYFCKTHFNIIFPSVSVDPGPGNKTGQVGQEAVPHASKSYQRRTTGIIFLFIIIVNYINPHFSLKLLSSNFYRYVYIKK